MQYIKFKSNINGKVTLSNRRKTKVVETPQRVSLKPGKYVIKAMPVKHNGRTYVPVVKRQVCKLRKNKIKEVTVKYRPQEIPADPLPNDDRIIELHNLTNKMRVEGYNGHATAPLLKFSLALSEAAYLHAREMAENKYFSHTSLDGSTLEDRINRTSFKGDPSGENIASGQPTPAIATYGWSISPLHFENLMDSDHTHVGYGYAIDNTESQPIIYWVQNFGYDPV